MPDRSRHPVSTLHRLIGVLLVPVLLAGCITPRRSSPRQAPRTSPGQAAPTAVPPLITAPGGEIPPPPAPSTPPASVATPPPPPLEAPAPPPSPPTAPPHLARLEPLSRQPLLTRGTLAVLLFAIPGLPRDSQAPVPIMTDILDHPARDQILAAVQGGYLDPYPNHQFRPEGLVSRLDLARCLAVVVRALPGRFGPRSRSIPVQDIPPSNRHHDAVQAVVGAGLFTLEDGRFLPARSVTGQEAWNVILRLDAALRGTGA